MAQTGPETDASCSNCLEEELKTAGVQDAPADGCSAEAEDVVCDVCPGKKRKAVKSCLVCQASFCDGHLQQHRDAAPLKKHKLVEPTQELLENICPRHDEVLKMFCLTDRQSICYVCSVDEHKGHDIVSTAMERTERQKELEESRQEIQQRIRGKQENVKVLQEEVEAINRSADKAVQDSQETLTQMIRQLEERRLEVKQQVTSTQKAEVSRVKELQKKLEEEIAELKRRDAELEKISHTHDHNRFLHSFSSLPPLSESLNSPIQQLHPLSYFDDVAAAVSVLRDQTQEVLVKTFQKITWMVRNVNVLLPEPEPRTREDFLCYSCHMTLDQNTANRRLQLSEGNRKVTLNEEDLPYDDHPDRFTYWIQVLSRETLTGRCYWEVERRGGLHVAIVSQSIRRAGNSRECRFGLNDNSWTLHCFEDGYEFYHNGVRTPVSGPVCSRVGVFLDHRAGVLCFYGVSEAMTLLHRVQANFPRLLHAGLRVSHYNSSAELCS